jgi:hypothetical protein
MRPNSLLVRFLVLVTLLLTALVVLAVGRRVPMVLTGAVAFGVIGLGVHALAGLVLDREGTLPLARAGVAYPVLSCLFGAVWSWQKVSVPLALLLIVAAVALIFVAATWRRPRGAGRPAGGAARPA